MTKLLDFDLKGYEKKLDSLFVDIYETCIKLVNSNIKDEVLLGNKYSYILAEAIHNIDEVKNKKELFNSYVNIEKSLISTLEELQWSWAYPKRNIMNYSDNESLMFLTEEPNLD